MILLDRECKCQIIVGYMTLRNCSEEGCKLDVLLLGSYLGGHCCIYHQLDNPKHELELSLNVIEHPGTYQTCSHSHMVQGKLTILDFWILNSSCFSGGTLSCPPVRPRPCMRQSVRQVVLQCATCVPFKSLRIQCRIKLVTFENDFVFLTHSLI